MRILVVGGFGFVGGRVARHLHHAGHAIVLGTRNAYPSPVWLPQADVALIHWHDAAALERSCRGVDVVIHAAGMNAQDCAADPVAALEFNGVATARLLTGAMRAGVQRFICFSTAHVYASPLAGTITEKTCPRNLHPYATSHLAGEYAVLGASQRGQIQGVVLRLSNAVGVPVWKEANCWTLLVNDLCRQAVVTGQLKLHTAGSQLRDFIALEDVVRAVLHIVQIEPALLSDGLFNLGGDAALSILSMTEQVAARWKVLTDHDLAIIRPEPSGPLPESLAYSCDKLKATGFSLTSQVHQEIDATLGLCMAAFGK
ncbi:MAG: SDR family oxidoreductase [Nitrospira sp.]